MSGKALVNNGLALGPGLPVHMTFIQFPLERKGKGRRQKNMTRKFCEMPIFSRKHPQQRFSF